MPTPRASLAELWALGLDLRAWCLRCGRGERMALAPLLPRLGGLSSAEAAARFRCRICRRADGILLLPASRPPSLPAPREIEIDGEITGARFVAMVFHALRGHGKRQGRRR